MTQMEIQKTISNYALDNDPRVRKSALDALVQMHLRGSPLDLATYNLAVSSLRDDHEEVRIAGLNLIGVLSSLYPDHRMKLAHEQVDETTRLIDDAFNKVCDLVNDSVVVIRTKACVMMASYQHVSIDTLKQTFSKQIMSHLRRNVPRYKAQQKKYANGIIPIAEGDFDVQSDEFHLLDSGACGAFIHGLEDEYEEVRYASIDSICELCMYNEQLTKKAVECLVDMFNDEIDKIRVNAIQSLRKIGSRSILEFDEEQLEVAVGALEDSDPVARQATHDLFTVVRLTSENSMTEFLQAVDSNMKRYPEDTLSIYKCLRDFGKRHNDYVEHLIPSLLKLDKRYLPKEANVEDNLYTAYVILIINACVSNVKLLDTLPKYLFRHFAYFKSKYPECIPDLRKLYKKANIKLEGDVDCLPMTFSTSEKKIVAEDAENYMMATTDMLQTIKTQVLHGEYSTALLTLEVAIRNFKYITSLKPTFVGKSELAQLYLQCFEIIIQIKQSHSSPTYAATAQLSAAILLRLSYTIQHTFLGLSQQNLHAAMYFRIMANMIWIYLKDNIELSASLDGLKDDLIKASQTPSSTQMTALHSFITSFIPLDINLSNSVRQSKASITHPITNPDRPSPFASSFAFKVHVEANINNIETTTQIAIEVILPNKSSQTFWPIPDHFRPVTPYCYNLSTDINIDLSLLTESSIILLRIVQSFEPDLHGLDEHIMKYSDLILSNKSVSNETMVPNSSCVISNPVQYHLQPTK
ncbi:armadillo-type protein [Pilobolus umbonatus]|nr:armadillo-type protein [Pilobolus umbonatus]